ncbi:quattro isoform X2 [Brachyhypopomus gauderio]|uniref:quattro isoform X2 n=1 Tax=Brachyhypopomus gauderio TaxID=698409 RepID=UPI004042040B
MNPSSLDWSIQGALSSLFPPFEATAPTVLSQLFRTIEERYHGDALQCLLDYLIPAKHILESVQQAACAEYSDVLFLCEGWPLCLRDRVVIQLAPINPLLLRPGDFYLQVEPFGEQSARIVLKSLLVQEDLLAQDSLVGFRAQEGPTVEEAPIPETSYPCIFTEAWLKEVNEGRHGYQLQRCVLSSDQGIVKVPWAEVVNPEFLDKPKVQVPTAPMTSCSVIMRDNQSPEEEPKSQFPVNLAPLEIETMILPAKDGVAVSVRLVESGSRLVKVDQGTPVSHSVGKPVGRVSPNTWDSRHNRELEGEYVDLLDFAKDKEVLGLNKAIIPTVPVSFRPAPSPPKRNSVPCGKSSQGAMNEVCIPCSRSKQCPENFQKGSESKCRHRQSYLAALRNPVSFEKASVMAALDETWPGSGEVEPGSEGQGPSHGLESVHCPADRSSTRLGPNPVQSCKNFSQQDQNLVQSNMNSKHFDQNLTKPLLPAHFPDILPVLERKAFPESRHHYLGELPRQEPSPMRSSGQKHAKPQNLPKMGLRALPDHSSHRQEASAYKCQGVGRQQMNNFQCGLPSPQKDFTQPIGQRLSLFHHPQNNQMLLQDQSGPMDKWFFIDNKQCGESSVQVLKPSGRSKSKGRSVSLVTETARECVQVEKLTSRSRSDVYPEIIPMVPAIHAVQSNKCSVFGPVSPKLKSKKAVKNDTSPGAGELQPPPLVNGLKYQGSHAELPSTAPPQCPCPGHANQLTPPSLDPSIKSLLQLGIVCLPGSRDRAGRAILEVHGGGKGWACPPLCPLELCRLFLYLHSIPRREVRDLGLTVVIDSRKCPPPSVLYKALLMVQEQALHAVHSILLLVDKDQSPRPERKPGLQVDIVTSLKALHKTVHSQQLTSELGGTFPYNHTDWLQFQQKLSLFELDLHGATSLLQRAIKNLDSSKTTETAQDVKSCIQEQKTLMKEVLEDTRMVTLQREGGAMLARMRREEFRFSQSEDYRDAMEAVTSLYNQVEEGVHILVMRSNQSLQHLDHVLLLRETEEQLITTRVWCEEEEQRWMKDCHLTEETGERLEQRLADLHAVLTQAKEKKEKQLLLIKEVERKIQGTSYPETGTFHHNTMKFRTSVAAFLLQAEQYKSSLESFISLHNFCEEALSLSRECSHNLEQMEMGNSSQEIKLSNLKTLEQKLQVFSPLRFEEERSKVLTTQHQGEIEVWTEALAECQRARRRLEETLLGSDKNQTSQGPTLQDSEVLRSSEAPLQASSPRESSASSGDIAPGPQGTGVDSQAESTGRHTGSDGETLSLFHLCYSPGGKAKTGDSEPLMDHDVCKNITKNCKEEFRADLSSQTQIEETPTHAPFITSSSEKGPSFTLQDQLTESNNSPVNLKSSTDNNTALKNVLKPRRFSRKHHSESDLRTIDLAAGGDKLPWKRALGRSHSEGSCVNSNLKSTSCPVSVHKSHSTNKPNMLQDDQSSEASHQDNLCLDSPIMQLEWIQMGNTSQQVPLVLHGTQISHQGDVCSGVYSPTGAWEDEGNSGVTPDDRASGSYQLGPLTPDGMQDRSACSRVAAPENSSNALKLQHIMEELLDTEREYVRALGYVMEHYFPELERPDVPQDLRGQRGNIFGNLEKLRDFHQHFFLKELERCLKEPFLVGRCFLRHKESFGLYALYSKNKPRSDNLLIHYGKEFFKKQQLLGDKMDLSSYLLRPVQRISKYSLLLQDMLGEWDMGSHEGHERAEIQAALEVIQFQLRHGNNLLAMDDIQECDVNLKEQGQLIRQDEFLVSFRKKKCHRHIFLFQDLVLFSKTKKTEVGNDIYIYKQSFKTSEIGMTHNSGDSGLCFEIWFRRRKSQDTYTLQAGSHEVKESWTKDLERILWEQAIHNREVRMQERVFMGIGYKPFMDIKPSEAAICDRAINCALIGRECKSTVSSGMSDSQGGFPAQRPNSTGSTSWPSSVDSSESSGESVSGFSSSSYSCQSVIGGEVDEHSEMSVIGVRKVCIQKIEKNHQENKDQPKSSTKPQDQKRDQPLSKIQADNHMRTSSTEV